MLRTCPTCVDMIMKLHEFILKYKKDKTKYLDDCDESFQVKNEEVGVGKSFIQDYEC